MKELNDKNENSNNIKFQNSGWSFEPYYPNEKSGFALKEIENGFELYFRVPWEKEEILANTIILNDELDKDKFVDIFAHKLENMNISDNLSIYKAANDSAKIINNLQNEVENIASDKYSFSYEEQIEMYKDRKAEIASFLNEVNKIIEEEGPSSISKYSELKASLDRQLKEVDENIKGLRDSKIEALNSYIDEYENIKEDLNNKLKIYEQKMENSSGFLKDVFTNYVNKVEEDIVKVDMRIENANEEILDVKIDGKVYEISDNIKGVFDKIKNNTEKDAPSNSISDIDIDPSSLKPAPGFYIDTGPYKGREMDPKFYIDPGFDKGQGTDPGFKIYPEDIRKLFPEDFNPKQNLPDVILPNVKTNPEDLVCLFKDAIKDNINDLNINVDNSLGDLKDWSYNLSQNIKDITLDEECNKLSDNIRNIATNLYDKVKDGFNEFHSEAMTFGEKISDLAKDMKDVVLNANKEEIVNNNLKDDDNSLSLDD